MIRGTTPRHTFILPFGVETIECVRVIYRQNKKIIFTKTTEDVLLEDNKVEVILSQEDTLQFQPGHKVEIVVRVRLDDGTALASDSFVVSVGCCFEDEVI
jgi:hypothetical protein